MHFDEVVGFRSAAKRLLCGTCCAVLPSLSGCTLAGLAVGLDMKTYESTPLSGARMKQGEVIRLHVADRTPTSSTTTKDTFFVVGTYRGSHDGDVELESADGQQHIPADHVLDVRVQTGSYWWAGLAFGAAADAALIAVLVILQPLQRPLHVQ